MRKRNNAIVLFKKIRNSAHGILDRVEDNMVHRITMERFKIKSIIRYEVAITMYFHVKSHLAQQQAF